LKKPLKSNKIESRSLLAIITICTTLVIVLTKYVWKSVGKNLLGQCSFLVKIKIKLKKKKNIKLIKYYFKIIISKNLVFNLI
jgi:hypothetical protein